MQGLIGELELAGYGCAKDEVAVVVNRADFFHGIGLLKLVDGIIIPHDTMVFDQPPVYN